MNFCVTLTSELHEIERFPSIAIRMRRICRGIIVMFQNITRRQSILAMIMGLEPVQQQTTWILEYPSTLVKKYPRIWTMPGSGTHGLLPEVKRDGDNPLIRFNSIFKLPSTVVLNYHIVTTVLRTTLVQSHSLSKWYFKYVSMYVKCTGSLLGKSLPKIQRTEMEV
jgi:hypothetical protein